MNLPTRSSDSALQGQPWTESRPKHCWTTMTVRSAVRRSFRHHPLRTIQERPAATAGQPSRSVLPSRHPSCLLVEILFLRGGRAHGAGYTAPSAQRILHETAVIWLTLKSDPTDERGPGHPSERSPIELGPASCWLIRSSECKAPDREDAFALRGGFRVSRGLSCGVSCAPAVHLQRHSARLRELPLLVGFCRTRKPASCV